MSDDAKALASRATDIINGADVGLIDEVFSEDFVEHNPTAGSPGTREGRKQTVKALRGAFPDFHLEVHQQIAEGDCAVERWTATGTHKGAFMGVEPTGKTVEVEGIDISRVADGKIVEHWTQMDTVAMMQQLGLLGG